MLTRACRGHTKSTTRAQADDCSEVAVGVLAVGVREHVPRHPLPPARHSVYAGAGEHMLAFGAEEAGALLEK